MSDLKYPNHTCYSNSPLKQNCAYCGKDLNPLKDELAQEQAANAALKSRIAELETYNQRYQEAALKDAERIKEIEREVEHEKEQTQHWVHCMIDAEKERDRYKAALEKIDRVEFKNIDDVLEIAREALKPEGE